MVSQYTCYTSKLLSLHEQLCKYRLHSVTRPVRRCCITAAQKSKNLKLKLKLKGNTRVTYRELPHRRFRVVAVSEQQQQQFLLIQQTSPEEVIAVAARSFIRVFATLQPHIKPSLVLHVSCLKSVLYS